MNSECQANSSDDGDGQAVIRVGASKQFLNEDVLICQVRCEICEQRVEMRRRHRGIIVPPDGLLGGCVADGEFVFG